MLTGYDIEALKAFQRNAAPGSGAVRTQRPGHGTAVFAAAHARVTAAWLDCLVGSTFMSARLVWPRLFR